MRVLLHLCIYQNFFSITEKSNIFIYLFLEKQISYYHVYLAWVKLIISTYFIFFIRNFNNYNYYFIQAQIFSIVWNNLLLLFYLSNITLNFFIDWIGCWFFYVFFHFFRGARTQNNVFLLLKKWIFFNI